MIAVLGDEDGLSAFASVRGVFLWPQATSIRAHDAVDRKEDGRMFLVRRGPKVERTLMEPGKGTSGWRSVRFDRTALSIEGCLTRDSLPSVGVTGFEPATTCTPCKCATGLRYTPKQGANVTEARIRKRKAAFRPPSQRSFRAHRTYISGSLHCPRHGSPRWIGSSAELAFRCLVQETPLSLTLFSRFSGPSKAAFRTR